MQFELADRSAETSKWVKKYYELEGKKLHSIKVVTDPSVPVGTIYLIR